MASKKMEQEESIEAERLAASQPRRLELAAYAAVVATALAYFCYDFYKVYGHQPEQRLPEFLLKPGWLAPFRDATEFSILAMMRQHWLQLLLITAGFIVVSQLTLRFVPIVLHHSACSLYTLALTYLLIGHRATAYMLGLHALTLVAASRSKLCVWVVVLAAMLVQNRTLPSWSLDDWLQLSGRRRTLFYPIIGYYYCRLISCGHWLTRSPSRSSWRQLPLTLHYMFYYPYLFCGPILTLEQFSAQVTARSQRRPQLPAAACLSCRLLLWLMVSEIGAHFLPIGAFLTAVAFSRISSSSYSHLALAVYLFVQDFMLLNVQLYGWPGVASRLDGVVLPDWPICTSRIYRSKTMWRDFDRGLYLTIQENVYRPIMDSRWGTQAVRRVVAVASAFAFVDIYHGDSLGMRLWTGTNAAATLFELVIGTCYDRFLVRGLSRWLHPILHTRIVVFVISFNSIITYGINYTFIFEESAYTIVDRFLTQPLTLAAPIQPLLILNCLTYCCVQLSMAYNRKLARKRKEE